MLAKLPTARRRPSRLQSRCCASSWHRLTRSCRLWDSPGTYAQVGSNAVPRSDGVHAQGAHAGACPLLSASPKRPPLAGGPCAPQRATCVGRCPSPVPSNPTGNTPTAHRVARQLVRVVRRSGQAGRGRVQVTLTRHPYPTRQRWAFVFWWWPLRSERIAVAILQKCAVEEKILRILGDCCGIYR